MWNERVESAVDELLTGLAGLAAFGTVLTLAHLRFRGGEQSVASTDLGLD